jgi:signal transduction histidine kinase
MDILSHYFLALFITGISHFLLALFVLVKNPRAPINRTYALYSFAISVWSIFEAFAIVVDDKATALLLWRICNIGTIFITVFFVHFVFNFLNIYGKKKKLIRISYLIGCFFLICNFSPLSPLFINDITPKLSFNIYFINPGILYYAFLPWWLGLMAVGLYSLHKYVFNPATSAYRRNQIKYFYWSMLIAYIGGVPNFLPKVSNIEIPLLMPFGTYAVVLYAVCTAYAILRHRLMDINFVINRTMVYSLSVGLLSGLLVILVLTITNIFSIFVKIDPFIVSIVLAPLVAILFTPLRNRIQGYINKAFFKKSYDYYEAVQQITTTLSSIFNLKGIYRFVGNVLLETLGLRNVRVLAASESEGCKVVYQTSYKEKHGKELSCFTDSIMTLQNFPAIVELISLQKDIIIKEEVLASRDTLSEEALDNLEKEFQLFDSAAAVPVFADGKLTHIIMLGEKLSGDMFTTEDINLLRTVASQSAVAIKNARHYADQMTSEKLMSMGMMSATFAHEIRNPLTSVKMFTQMMPDKFDDPAFRELCSKTVKEEIEKIDTLIDDLLDFSDQRKSSVRDEVDVSVVIDETIDYVGRKLMLSEHNIDIQKMYNGDSIRVRGDGNKLRRAFLNVIYNGCQAMEESGTMEVNIHRNGRHVHIGISDTGPGIPDDRIDEIFSPFVSYKDSGFGLGLAISKRIIDNHGGKIGIQSTSSEGTTFTITLPIINR